MDGDRPKKRRDFDEKVDSPRRGSDRGLSRDLDRPPRRDSRDDRGDRRHSRGGRDERPPFERERSNRPRSPPPPPRYVTETQASTTADLALRLSPTLEPTNDEPVVEEPNPEDSEARSVFVSQLAARLTARDLGYFFEDKLGDNTVLDARIVTDRLSRRSKGYGHQLLRYACTMLITFCSIGYVEFRNIDLVDKAINLSGTVVMGLPIKVQLTEAERNRTHAGDGYVFAITVSRVETDKYSLDL